MAESTGREELVGGSDWAARVARWLRHVRVDALVVSLLALVIGVVYALVLPPGAGRDEPMHVARAAQIAQGNFLPVEVDPDHLDTSLVGPTSDDYVAYGGETDASLYWLLVRGNLSFYQSGDEDVVFSFPSWESPSVRVNGEMGNWSVTWLFPNTSVNSPLSYAPHVLGYALSTSFGASPGVVVLVMRLAGVLAYAAAIYACMSLLPVGRWAFALVSLLPVAVGTNSAVTADLMTFVSLSLYFCCLVRMLWTGRAGTLEWAVLWSSLAVLCLAKVSYAPFGLLLFLLPALRKEFRERRSLLLMLAAGISSLALFALWYGVIHEINTGLMWTADIDPEAQSAYVTKHPLEFLSLVFDSLGRTDVLALGSAGVYGASVSGSWITVLPLAVCLMHDALRLRSAEVRPHVVLGIALGSVFVCLLSAVLVHLALYLQFTPPGADAVNGIQSRYFLPLAFPLCLSALVLCAGLGAPRDGSEAVPVECENVSGKGEFSTDGRSVMVASLRDAVAPLFAIAAMALVTTVSFVTAVLS